MLYVYRALNFLRSRRHWSGNHSSPSLSPLVHVISCDRITDASHTQEHIRPSYVLAVSPSGRFLAQPWRFAISIELNQPKMLFKRQFQGEKHPSWESALNIWQRCITYDDLVYFTWHLLRLAYHVAANSYQGICFCNHSKKMAGYRFVNVHHTLRYI